MNSIKPPVDEPLNQPQQYTSQQVASLYRALRKNREYYLSNLLKIQTKSGNLSPFKPNEPQRFIIDLIWCLNELEVPVRLVICKARQIGMSTLGAGLLFHATTMWPHRHAKVIAHDTDTTELLFEKSKMFYNQLPEGPFKPKTERSDRKQIVYSDPIHSRLTISTAGTKTAGSGATVQYLHCSEVAKWENPGTVMTSLMQSVPKASVNPNTVIIIESTANGQGGYYHEQYKEAKAGKEQLMQDLWVARGDKEKMLSILQSFPRNIGWLPIFFPWYEFKEYQEKIVDVNWFRGSLTPEELELKQRYNLSLEQLQFRRTEIENLKKDERGIPPEELFKQEYPSNDTEAFLVTGSTFFHQPSLQKQSPKPEVFKGNLYDEMKSMIDGKMRDITYDEWRRNNCDDDGHVKLLATEDIYGSLSIWEQPEKGAQYVVSGDVSLGEKENSDFSVLQILKKLPDGSVEQVARWRGKIHPEVFAKYGIQLAAYYNEGILCFENNSFGVNCIRVLQNSLYPFPYIRNQRNFKEISDAPTDEWGWNTNVGTKGPVVAEANRRLYEGLLTLNDPITIEELSVFRQEGPQRLSAPEGMHDDCVMSLAIGLWVVSEHPYSPYTIEGAIPLADMRQMERSAEIQPDREEDYDYDSYETSFA